MKINYSSRRFCLLIVLFGLLVILSGCAVTNPVIKDIDIRATPPYAENNEYTEALYQIGRMTEIYNAPPTIIQSEDIFDDTGVSSPLSTGGEIQRDISEIMKSALNSIGGRLTFVEYNPSYINNQMATGYSNFKDKIIPDVVVTGGITGFDRALKTTSDNKDAGVDVQFPNIQNSDGNLPPTDLIGVSYTEAIKRGTAQISLDFNMKSFKTLAGIPYMSTTNSMLVHKALRDRELAITIFGPTFGLKGNTKKVQGRHQAVRILVQLSAIQLVGKYMALPYWRLLGEDTRPDRVVLLQLDRSFAVMNEFDRLVNIQQWLFLHNYEIDISGEMDNKTIAALKQFSPDFNSEKPTLTKDVFRDLYLTIPLDDKAYNRRMVLNALFAENG